MSKRTCDHESGVSGVEKRRKAERSVDRTLRGTGNPQLMNKAYTVGWICAITTEYIAAQLFLDKKHMRPESQPKEDTNHYTLGEIGGHNVIIAVLPGGEYGTNSAANVASNMLRTFPHIRIGLMVGIGGGAPSEEHDIRLGDVVVSMPSGGNGGVLQYDFGKTVQDREFCMTGFLDQPPTLLRTAVCGLQVHYEMHGHCLNESIDITLQKWPKVDRKKYGRPDINTDRLYGADVVHNQQHCCLTSTSDSRPEPISQPQRTEDTHNPVIHYGLIGSANQLMKDALARDRLSKEKGILCFEMEAAGLMNHFPCLVIRGICDYSDSHKNKQWQGYAAMTAAAYTKDLLCQIPPSDVVAEEKINEFVIESVSRIEEDVETLKFKADRQEDLEVLDWISPVDYGPQQSDFFNRAQPGTGQWFLNSAEYQDWLNTRTNTLFCPGMPGAGKTILASIIINNLWRRFRENASIGIAYIYCNFRRKDEQTPQGFTSSLLKQLAERQFPLPRKLKDLYKNHQASRTRPSSEDLSEALHFTLMAYSRVYVVIDALDECDASNGCRARFLSEIFHFQSSGKVSILVTSRQNPEIQSKLKKSVILEIRATQEDVQIYVDNRMSDLPAFIRDDSGLQQDIKASISRTADGMFLLAQLYLDSLKGKLTFKAVRKALKDLVTGSDAYEHAYNGAMERINGQLREEADLAKRVLSWITFAKRPLVTEELRHALSVEVGTSHFNEENLLRVDMVSLCAGLVTMDKESNIIRLVHYTTQQYFEKYFRRWFNSPHVDITETCLTYLSFQPFDTGFTRCHEEYSARLESNPFYSYASCNWGYHAHLAPTCQDVLPFLQKQSHVEATSQVLLGPMPDCSLSGGGATTWRRTGLHLAAYFGLQQVQDIVRLYDVNERDSCGQTPLLYAAENGHEAAVQLLLANGADIEAKREDGWTALASAVLKSHKTTVRLLLNNGANPEPELLWGPTPLLIAVYYRNEDIIQMLLENGADIKSKCGEGLTVLWLSTIIKDKAIERLVLSWEKVRHHKKKGPGGFIRSARLSGSSKKDSMKFSTTEYTFH
ncbi:hypothetical protein F4824DRAFT_473880 [Ustulina deusta]|nr:hypothetical protein F4824DRAFT_473880 [Ustulina deusta]